MILAGIPTRPGNVEFQGELELAQYAELQHTLDT